MEIDLWIFLSTVYIFIRFYLICIAQSHKNPKLLNFFFFLFGKLIKSFMRNNGDSFSYEYFNFHYQPKKENNNINRYG